MKELKSRLEHCKARLNELNFYEIQVTAMFQEIGYTEKQAREMAEMGRGELKDEAEKDENEYWESCWRIAPYLNEKELLIAEIEYLESKIKKTLPVKKQFKRTNKVKALCLIKAYLGGKISDETWTNKPKFMKLVDETVKGSYRIYSGSRDLSLWEKRDTDPEDKKQALELYNKHFEKPG